MENIHTDIRGENIHTDIRGVNGYVFTLLYGNGCKKHNFSRFLTFSCSLIKIDVTDKINTQCDA